MIKVFSARLKPCPSYRDAFPFSCLTAAPNLQFVKNAPLQWTTLKTQGFGESHWKPRPGQPLQHDWRLYWLPADLLQTMQPGTANSVDPQWMSPEERAKSAEIDKKNAARAAARTKALAASAHPAAKP